jgi:alpha-mannosidase
MTGNNFVHLVCNAHLDPVWLWEWEEGAAAAISTFRTAADLCEEFDGFVFNHNEALLYRWVEEYEPALFERIQRLVKAGKWHIMGGWYLQPDCNMPSGESFIRQALLGRRYFAEKFGARPTTAINFDPFGHTRGLAQILAGCGFDSYLICRPGQENFPIERDEFFWEGFDDSRVTVVRAWRGYNSGLGKAVDKLKTYLQSHPGPSPRLLLWGVGDHGGGASREDLRALAAYLQESPELLAGHSTPEAYFADLRAAGEDLPVVRSGINAWAVGCYTSQVRVKQLHRRVENELWQVEKMAAAAWMNGGMAYSKEDLREAMHVLAAVEFHDSLPGSSIQAVEEMALRQMDHALELLSRLRARSFFALAQGQQAAQAGEIPVLVYNPHPFPVQAVVECEFMLSDQNWADEFTGVEATAGGEVLPAQVEQEASHLNLDWRKRVVFQAELQPARMNRFDMRLRRLPARPTPALKTDGRVLFHRTEQMEARINLETGLLDGLRVGGTEFLRPGAFCPLVMWDDADPWAMRVESFRSLEGAFHLLDQVEAARFSGLGRPLLPAVRVVEDGAVRTVVEALLGYGSSRICQRYLLNKHGSEIEIETRVYWNEKDRMLKLAVPTCFTRGTAMGQTAFGVERLRGEGKESVAQRWAAVVAEGGEQALTLINSGTYGLDALYGELRLSLLRSAAYSCHPINDRPYLPEHCFTPRMDQGERVFRFWLNAGAAGERLQAVDREATAHGEQPVALSFFPNGGGSLPQPLVLLDDPAIQLSAIKQAEDGDGLILRLYNPTGETRATRVSGLVGEQQVELTAYKVRTFRIHPPSSEWTETNMVEETA